MNISQSDRNAVLDRIADRLTDDILAAFDLSEIITMPTDVVAQMTGLTAAHVARVMPTRSMGKRKIGVSLKEIKSHQQQQNRK
jgi:hypothetical protein